MKCTTVAASPVVLKVKWPVNILFDPIGLMGNGQVFTIKASVRNAITSQVFDKSIAPTPVFSIVSGPATVSGDTVTCGTTNGDVTIRAIVQGPLFMTTQRETTFTLDASKLGKSCIWLGKIKVKTQRFLWKKTDNAWSSFQIQFGTTRSIEPQCGWQNRKDCRVSW